MEKKKTIINDLEIVYYENCFSQDNNVNINISNNINTIVFLHGWGADKNNLALIYNNFVNLNYRVIALDLPGFGESSKPDDSWGSFQYAKLLEDFFDKINVKDALFVGHSFGGKIASIIAYNRPDIVSKLVLISASCLRNRRTLLWYLKVWTYKLLKNILFLLTKNQNIIEKLRNKFGSEDYKNANNMRKILVNVVNEDITDILKIIKLPVFLYWGEKDNSTPLWMAKKMKKIIKDCGLYIVKNGSHYPFLEDLTIIPVIKSLLN